MFRHWRILVSLICFTLFLTVIVFWVRSYTRRDELSSKSKTGSVVDIASRGGDVYFISDTNPLDSPRRDLGWQVTSQDYHYSARKDHRVGFLGFVALSQSSYIVIAVPYWFISIIFALLCGLPWFWRRFNFSLRTFLVAFTVAAIVLGMIAWLDRAWIGK